ncbi:hypothetical protein CHS0354_009194 [Potamilus streckersoni]|uniref:Uncharacterized protein n=1 Tax=Potamilus streckersoni TaxID=2493646 RepID=A0AAE0SZJ8_9BIVA|nr:hypothetical protein CHS0354_009194 [Potamilus streckersoni]
MTSYSEMKSFTPYIISSPTSISQILFLTKVTSSAGLSPEMTFVIPEMTSSSKMILSSAVTTDSAITSIQSSFSVKTFYSEIKSNSDVMPRISDTITLSHDKTSSSPLITSSSEIKASFKNTLIIPEIFTSKKTLNSEIITSNEIISLVSQIRSTSLELISSSKIKSVPLGITPSSSDTKLLSFAVTPKSEINASVTPQNDEMTSSTGLLSKSEINASVTSQNDEMTSSTGLLSKSEINASVTSQNDEMTSSTGLLSKSEINASVTSQNDEMTSSTGLLSKSEINASVTSQNDEMTSSTGLLSKSEINASVTSQNDEMTSSTGLLSKSEINASVTSQNDEMTSSTGLLSKSEINASVTLQNDEMTSKTGLLSKSEINASVTSQNDEMTSSTGLLSNSETTDPYKISTFDATSHSKITSIVYETMNPGSTPNSDAQLRFQITSVIFEMKTSSSWITSLNAISSSEKPLPISGITSIFWTRSTPSDSWITSRVDIRPSRVDIRPSSYWVKSREDILSSSSEKKSTDSRIITAVNILPSNSDIIIGYGVTTGVEVLLSSFDITSVSGITSRVEVLSSSPRIMLSTSLHTMQSVSTSVTLPMITAQQKVTDILLLKVKVKKDVDIFGDKFNKDAVRGLMECFKEGRAQSPQNRKQRGITMWQRKNLHELRDMLPGNIEVMIIDVSRDKKTLETVSAQFYVKENGAVVPVKEAEAVYGQLTMQETSALLTYPVLQPIMSAAVTPTITSKNEEFFTPATIMLICIPAGVLVLATILLLFIFCQIRWKQEETSAKYWRKYSSLVKRKPTLTDYDLMIDMEMGEVINTSHSPGKVSFKNLQNWKKETYNEFTNVKQVPELDVNPLFELSKFPSTVLRQALSTNSQTYSDSELIWKQLVWKLSMEEKNEVVTFSEPKSIGAKTSEKHLVNGMIYTDFDNFENNRKVQHNILVNKTAEAVTNVLPQGMAQTILKNSPVSKHRKSQFKNKTTPINYGTLSLPKKSNLISKAVEEFSNKIFTEPGDLEISLTNAKDYKQKQLKNDNVNSLVSDSEMVVHHSKFTSDMGGIPMDKVPILKNSVKGVKISTTIPTICHGGKLSLFSDDASDTQDKQIFFFTQREPHASAQEETKILKNLKQLGKGKPNKSGKQTQSDILFTANTKRKKTQKLTYPQKYPNIPVDGYCNRILEKPFYKYLTLSTVKQKVNAENNDQSGDNDDTSKNDMFYTPKNELTPLQQNSEIDSDFAYRLTDDGHLMQSNDYDSEHEFYPNDHNINDDDDSDQETYPFYENVTPIFLEYFGGFCDLPQSTLHYGNFR